MPSRVLQFLGMLLWIFAATSCSEGSDDDSAAGDDDLADDDDVADDDTAAFDPALAQELDEVLEQLREEYDAPGIAAAVRMDDGRQWIGAVGVSELVDETPLDASDPFKIASITKTFTAAVVLQLVGEGALTLDDSLEQWYPGFARGDEITLRQLLNHSSGIPDYGTVVEYQTSMDQPWTDEELVALVDGEPLLFEPGNDWSYSNTNYVLLGLVVDAATGLSWESEMEQRLLVPLGLDSTRLPDFTDGWGDVVPGYIEGVDYTDTVHPSAASAAGCLVSTAEDLVMWSSEYFGGDVLDANEAGARVEDPIPVGGPFSYGLGVLIVDDVDGLEWGHNGALNGYASWVGYRPMEGIAISFLTNSWWVDPDTGSLDYQWPLYAVPVLWEVVLDARD